MKNGCGGLNEWDGIWDFWEGEEMQASAGLNSGGVNSGIDSNDILVVLFLPTMKLCVLQRVVGPFDRRGMSRESD